MADFRLPRLLASVCLLLVACDKKEGQGAPSQAPSPATQQKPGTEPTAEPAEDDLGYGDDVRRFTTAREAVEDILGEKPQVIGFGEFHKLSGSATVRSTMQRFTDEILPVLGPGSSELVLESWQTDPSCGAQGEKVSAAISSAIERPPETESEISLLGRRAQELGLRGHLLRFECGEYESFLEGEEVATDKLLATISSKLSQTGNKAWKAAGGKRVLLYGGATHNDLVPYQGLESWSYVKSLTEATGATYAEIDLYVPELVDGDPLLSKEAWYPLLAETREDSVLRIRRQEGSYIILMRKSLMASSTGQELQGQELQGQELQRQELQRQENREKGQEGDDSARKDEAPANQ